MSEVKLIPGTKVWVEKLKRPTKGEVKRRIGIIESVGDTFVRVRMQSLSPATQTWTECFLRVDISNREINITKRNEKKG